VLDDRDREASGAAHQAAGAASDLEPFLSHLCLLIALMIESPNNSWIGPPAIVRSDPDGIGSEPRPYPS
jgi:hypothetical protein